MTDQFDDRDTAPDPTEGLPSTYGPLKVVSDHEVQSALYGALAKAQGAFPAIPKDRTVRVQTKTGGSYTFAYAPLDTILREVRPALAENGLGITQTFDGDRLVTTLFHEGGGTIVSPMPCPRNQASWQEYGSAVTYARRYAITALLGIASEDDDDGNLDRGNVATPQERTKRDEPKPAAGTGRTGSAPRKVNERQIGLIHAVLKRLADAKLLSDEVYRGVLKREYGVDHSSELSSADASKLIERLKKLEATIPTDEAPAPADAPTEDAGAEQQELLDAAASEANDPNA